MKRTLVYGTATALVALGLGGCAQATTGESAPETPVEQDGPTGLSQTKGDDGSGEEPVEDLYGPPIVDEEWDDSVVEALYGPPPDFEDQAVEVMPVDDDEDRSMALLYGPPPTGIGEK